MGYVTYTVVQARSAEDMHTLSLIHSLSLLFGSIKSCWSSASFLSIMSLKVCIIICVGVVQQYSLALGFEYKTCMNSLSSLWTSAPFAREIFFTVFSSSAFCTRCSQALNSCTPMTHSPSFSCRDTFSWASSFWMSVSFFSSSSNWDYISQMAI